MPSAARRLSVREQEDLRELALSLPESWCVTIEAPHGQLAVSPLAERQRYFRCWVASRALGRIAREPLGRPV